MGARIEALCVERGLKMTEQRRVIARVLSQATDHPDVEQLYQRAVDIDPRISIATVYRLILAIGTGPGLVLILRWYWWRINAWAELAAMVAGFVVGFLTSVENPIYSLVIDDFGIRLMVTAGITLLIWVPIMLLTRPENDEKLDAFYTRVRPGGPGWKRQQERTGIAPAQDMASDIQRVLAGVLILFGAMFAVGGLLLLRWGTAAMMTIMLIVGLLWLRKLGAPVMAPPTSEAPTHPS